MLHCDIRGGRRSCKFRVGVGWDTIGRRRIAKGAGMRCGSLRGGAVAAFTLTHSWDIEPREETMVQAKPTGFLEEESVKSIGTKERKVIFASSLGTVFEWYDFYLYATLAPFFAALFFPSGNETAALLSAFATYAAGFLVRPFGAIVFGRIGDLVGRKYTFLVTIIFMGGATFLVGLLPTFQTIGWAAPVLLVTLRLVQGLALGGEYGGAATYVAEHAPQGKRGYDTAWIQTTATLGLFMALIVIGVCRWQMGKYDLSHGLTAGDTFKNWGWRLPFLVSLILLAFSVYIRLKLQESPIFKAMKAP